MHLLDAQFHVLAHVCLGWFGKDAATKAATPAQWAERSMPFLMSLGKEHNGQSLTCPGAPATHVDRSKITDKPSWACGFGPPQR